MKIALVHDYLTQRGGAERVFQLLCQHFPDADIFTSLYDRERTVDLGDRVVHTTMLQHIPGASDRFRLLAPLYYPVFRTLDLRDYDLIISSSSSFAKAVRKKPTATHICFCHNVTRFLWDSETYLEEYKQYQQLAPLLSKIFQAMRQADKAYAQEPDLYIANSSVVADRIRKYYNREAMVINYPIDDSQFIFSGQKDNFCLAISRILSYKRIDLTVKAFKELGWPLLIAGDGPERQRLQMEAGDAKNIKFLGEVSDEQRRELLSTASSVVVTALEDYGLVPIEANASGTPVVAYGEGGVRDTQVDGKTGVLFRPQNADALRDALLKTKEIKWDYRSIRQHALNNFSQRVFFNQVDRTIEQVVGLNFSEPISLVN
jgi:glycosyltransferase involved in cell wall biosynthesis